MVTQNTWWGSSGWWTPGWWQTTQEVTDRIPFPTEINGTAIKTLGIITLYNSVGVTLKRYTPEMIGRTQNFGWAEWANVIFLTPKQTAGISLTPLIWREIGCTTSGQLAIPEDLHYLVPLYVYSKVLTKYKFHEEALLVKEQYESEMERLKWRK